jgi:hypothetical protein
MTMTTDLYDFGRMCLREKEPRRTRSSTLGTDRTELGGLWTSLKIWRYDPTRASVP